MKRYDQEKWRTTTGDPLDEYAKTLRKMHIILLNTPPEKMAEFEQRFEVELMALEKLIDLEDQWRAEDEVRAIGKHFNGSDSA